MAAGDRGCDAGITRQCDEPPHGGARFGRVFALVWHFERPGGVEFQAHNERLGDYLYLGADGLKMQGYNSSELWDLTFACQAVVASGRAAEYDALIRKAHGFLDRTQVREDVPDRERC